MKENKSYLNVKLVTALDLFKWFRQIEEQKASLSCAPISELAYNMCHASCLLHYAQVVLHSYFYTGLEKPGFSEKKTIHLGFLGFMVFLFFYLHKYGKLHQIRDEVTGEKMDLKIYTPLQL